MIRCTGCHAVISQGHEVMIDDMPYHTSCVEKVSPIRGVPPRAPSSRDWDDDLKRVVGSDHE